MGLKRAVIKEELVALTGDYKKAILLNQLIYWSERIKDFDVFIQEENKRIEQYTSNSKIELTHGWIYKTCEDLSSETMLKLSNSNIRKHLTYLIEKKWLSERRNPKYKWDKTFQYRVNISNIQADLEKLGFSLDNYRISKTENRSSKTENRSSKTENRDTEIENRSGQNEKAIPEITTEITTEIPSINLEDKKRLDCKNYEELISKNISYEVLKIDYNDNPIIDNIYQLIIEIVTSKKEYVKISGENKPIEIVKSIFLKLNEGHIRYLIDSFNDNTTKIKNIKSYIITSLYNTYSTIDLHYKNCVNDSY